MVNAIAEEATEKVASKEAEIASLKKRLQSCESDNDAGSRYGMLNLVPDYLVMSTELKKAVARMRQGFLDATVESSYQEHLYNFRIAVNEQLLFLKDDVNLVEHSSLHERVDGLRVLLVSGLDQISEMFGVVKGLVFEHQWGHQLQREVTSIMFQNYIRGLQNEFELKLFEQRDLIDTMKKNWEERVAELTALRGELDAVSKFVVASESSVLNSQNIFGGSGDWSILRRNDGIFDENESVVKEISEVSEEDVFDIPEFAHLKHLSSEEIVSFFKSEMLKMKRQHEKTLEKKTEEHFKLRRAFLKERGSSPLRKDKDFELIKTKIPQVISKLDEVILTKRNFPLDYNVHDELQQLKDRIDSLVYKNGHLRGLLAEKRKEATHLSSQVSDAASKTSLHQSKEAEHLNQIEKLTGKLEGSKIEGKIRALLDKTIFREVAANYESYIDDINIQSQLLQELPTIVFRDVLLSLNSTMQEQYLQKYLLEQMFVQTEKTLGVMHEENQKLEKTITALSTPVDEKEEQLASVTESTLIQDKEYFDVVGTELSLLREQVSKQALQILESEKESDSLKSRLSEDLQQSHEFKLEIDRLTENLKSVSTALKETEKQNTLLHDKMEEKAGTLALPISNEANVEHQEFLIISMDKMSKAFSDLENRFAETIGSNNTRLEVFQQKLHPLLQQVQLLKKKELRYKQVLESRCSDLQKAEVEVDLLGDEVDTLLSLLGKIYVALDHYSPVLEHYPGIMEILKLVQKVLKGEEI